jgi:hypothetical protein
MIIQLVFTGVNGARMEKMSLFNKVKTMIRTEDVGYER